MEAEETDVRETFLQVFGRICFGIIRRKYKYFRQSVFEFSEQWQINHMHLTRVKKLILMKTSIC